ncbi:MAG: hypothetical protein K2H89_05670, partial [Oscillospiraceae bacterium]|nr:hypothetical protein [Oscillospiraceae bacterium]
TKPASKPAPAPQAKPVSKPAPEKKPFSKPAPEEKPVSKPAPAPEKKPVQKAKPAVPMMPDMASLLEDAEKFVAAEEQNVSANTAKPAPAEKVISDDVFKLEEEQPASADKFQPEEEQILDIDSFSQSGIAFNTALRARAAGSPNKKNKNQGFDFNDWVDETSEEIRHQKKKRS